MMRLQYGLAVIMLLLCGSERAHAADPYVCRPIEVLARPNMVRVLCELPVARNIFYLAASAEPDFRFATRVVALAAVAQATQKTLMVELVDPADNTGSAFGCTPVNCWPLKGIALTERSAPTPPSDGGKPPGSKPPLCPSSRPECCELNDNGTCRICKRQKGECP